MKKIFILLTLLLASTALSAQDKKDYDFYSKFNGKTVERINITTTHIKPNIVKNKFLMKEGDTFYYNNFNYARRALHDMKVFKKVNCDIKELDNGNLEVNINGEDGHYIFPILLAMGGSKTTVAGGLLEANTFKHGELAMLLAAGNSDGFMTVGNLSMSDNSFTVMYNKFDYDEKRYDNGSYNSSGLFSADDDDDDNLVNEYKVKREKLVLMYGKSFKERFSFGIGYAFDDVKYRNRANTTALPGDEGSHNIVFADIKAYKNIKPSKGMAGAFGSIFGLGTSSIEEEIADLPYVKPGYYAQLEYKNGGSHTGADYTISGLSASLLGSLELKKRHILSASVNAAQTFEGGFHDMTASEDLMTRGKYGKEIRGEKGWGAGASAALYLMRNKTGVMVLEPFVETSYLFDNHTRYNQTGAGANLTFMFWRFQFPLGINYTKNTVDGEHNISFMLGGGF
ncbi:hypothetical protein AAIR98_000707 [Elusimicrobium simillimum]|uniref:hypothetical protein n=1 Tax=Elusimicrobium simillimum TaxID=3143438 RepID=UPI003C6FF944